MSGIYNGPDGQLLHGDGKPVGRPSNTMTTPTQSPTPEALKAAKAINGEGKTYVHADNNSCGWYDDSEIADLIDRKTNLPALKKVVEAARMLQAQMAHIWTGMDAKEINDSYRSVAKADDALRAALDDLTPSA